MFAAKSLKSYFCPLILAQIAMKLRRKIIDLIWIQFLNRMKVRTFLYYLGLTLEVKGFISRTVLRLVYYEYLL